MAAAMSGRLNAKTAPKTSEPSNALLGERRRGHKCTSHCDLREKGHDIPKASGLSYRFSQKRVLFETVQEILDYLGYELKIVKKEEK